MLRRAFKAPTISVEAIHHQKDTRIFREISAQFQSILDIARPNVNDVAAAFTEVDKIVLRRTGINIDLKYNKALIENAYVIPPDINKNHPLIREWTRPYFSDDDAIRSLKKIQKDRLEFQIDRKNAKIKGDIASFKIIVVLYMGLFIDGRYTADEITAVFMHELGHAWYWSELLANQVSTNQALRAVSQGFLKTNDPELKIQILREAERVVGPIENKDQLAQSTTAGEVETVVIKSAMRQCRSELGSNVYDQRGFEYLADQFVARFGGALHLAKAMEKIYNHPHYKHASFRSGTFHVFSNIAGLVQSVFMTALLATAGVAMTLPVIAAIGAALLAVGGVLFLAGDPLAHGETDSYDRPGERFMRMKRELIDSLKDKDMDKETRAAVVSSIESIDRILTNVKDRWSWYAQMWGILSPKGRIQRQKITEQQLLEQLANSDLYTLSSKLQTMA